MTSKCNFVVISMQELVGTSKMERARIEQMMIAKLSRQIRFDDEMEKKAKRRKRLEALAFITLWVIAFIIMFLYAKMGV